MYERTYHDRVLKNDEDVPKKKGGKKKQWRPNWKVILIGASVVVLTALFVVLARLSRLQIKSVEIEGTNVADPTDVSAFVMDQLQGNMLYLLPRTSIMLAPTARLERSIRAAFPRFETVSVGRDNLSTLRITVTEYGGVYLWCTDDAHCSFMDKNGIVFADAPYFSGTAYPRVFVGTSGELPFKPITDAQLATVALLIDRLHGINIEPAEFHFATDHQLDVIFVHNGANAKLQFDPTLDMEQSLEALFTGLRTQPFAGKFHDSTRMLQYIDLRFENKVVYKFL